MDEKDIAAESSETEPYRPGGPIEVSAKAQRRDEAAEEGKIAQLIVFTLGDEEFAASIVQIREIIRIGSVTPIPDCPDFIKGLMNVRGDITLVIDLKARFFLRVNKGVESKHIIMTAQDATLFGLMVDEVTEVLRIPEREIKPAPELVTKIDKIYINGLITLQNRLIILLDLAKVLSGEELTKLAELTKRHRTVEEAEEQDAKEGAV